MIAATIHWPSHQSEPKTGEPFFRLLFSNTSWVKKHVCFHIFLSLETPWTKKPCIKGSRHCGEESELTSRDTEMITPTIQWPSCKNQQIPIRNPGTENPCQSRCKYETFTGYLRNHCALVWQTPSGRSLDGKGVHIETSETCSS